MKRNLENLANQTFDVLIIGGGIHGAVAAWDAVLRGLSVALIERGDFGCATSQNSLKIIHGGLRYLQDGNLSRIRTMARERTTWMKIAPHLVHPLPCLTPTQPKLSRHRITMRAGLIANDLLSFDRNQGLAPQKQLPRGKIISRRELAEYLPGYDVSTSTGAALWYDAQVYNTERLLLDFILSAAREGAEVANYVEAVDFVRRRDRITGVQARDLQSGQVFEIQAKVVINCTGAWIDSLLDKVSLRSEYATSVALNITVDQVWSGIAAGLPSCPADHKPPQILFFVPWHKTTMIGTWHIPWRDSPSKFKMSEALIQRFTDEINSAHPALRLRLDDIRHVSWGFLPINKADAQRKRVRLTRDGVIIDHERKDQLPGLISILGVKYTTARVVAENAIDLAVEKLTAKTRKCQTHITPIQSGWIEDLDTFLNQAKADLSDQLSTDIIEHWALTYGSKLWDLLQCIEKQPELSERIDPHLPVTRAEVVHAVRHEMALTLGDVIQRRTELGAAGLPSSTILQECAQWMGNELGWTLEQQRQEVDTLVQAYHSHNGIRVRKEEDQQVLTTASLSSTQHDGIL
jgi:glycerol-3-phosphate dehydrogenase